jgi:hypothetical protein
MDVRHVPDPRQHANLFVVGDYLFDSTLNGVLDSADFVASWISEDMECKTRQPSLARELQLAVAR